MRRELTYVILGAVLLLSISLLVRSNWADEQDIISFISKKEEDHPIYLINTQGEVLQKLITAPGQPGTLTWSPDGHSIAYSSYRNWNSDIYVMDVKKNIHRQLTFHGSRDLWPAWSPNGKWIVFVSERAGNMDLYRMDVSGENVKRLTNQGDCGRPSWSPDSQWIVYASAPEGRHYSLFLMTAEGRRSRQLVENVPAHGCTWSPDGKQIAFISWNVDGGMDIFKIDVDGGNLRQLTWSDPGMRISSPIWSQSSEWIVYLLAEIPGVEKPGPIVQNFAAPVIYVVNMAGGGEPIEATRGLVSANGFEWVPEEFLSVSPSADKQTTLWGKLKQSEK